ncbi:MAG: hypothetical protein HOO96_32725 [Polyangiaceae bacterium]|nr:hypothetical protein [Polyangiaceae bacterium]
MKLAAVGAVVLGGLVMACGAAPDDAGVDADLAAASTTRVLLAPLTEASRASCREAAQTVYCSEADARAAIAACSPGAASAVTVDVRKGACRKGERVYPTAASCAQPVELNCAFYAGCLERSIPCGNDGYALAFGEKYCTAFRNARLSAAGQKWMGGVMHCLQEELVPELPGRFTQSRADAATCKTTFDTAFASHPRCYAAEDNSICFLPVADLLAITHTIGLEELFTRRTSSQVLSTAAMCVGQITSRLFGFGRSTTQRSHEAAPGALEVDEAAQLELQRDFWTTQAAAEQD